MLQSHVSMDAKLSAQLSVVLQSKDLLDVETGRNISSRYRAARLA